MKTKLVIFDIDGTLTRTNRVDGQCYVETVRSMIYPEFGDFEPEAYTHFTDSHIVLELYRRHQRREPEPGDLAVFKREYLRRLAAAFHLRPEAFAPVAGAETLLRSLPADWQVALATGCWTESALLKLAFSGIDAEGFPRGTAGDAFSRADILRTALHRARPYCALPDWERVVYVGDGIWDLRTCAELALPFVGIDAENDAHRRRQLGPHFLLSDYTDLPAFVRLLETAVAPRV